MKIPVTAVYPIPDFVSLLSALSQALFLKNRDVEQLSDFSLFPENEDLSSCQFHL